MIDRKALLADLQKLLPKLERDLLERNESAERPEIADRLRADYAAAQKQRRTAQSFTEWRADQITQVAAAWVLSAVFVRFLEDNALIDPPRLAGPGPKLRRARDEHELYVRAHPTHTDRDYLLALFDDLQSFPATAAVFGPHNPLRALPGWLSGDAAAELLGFVQKIDPTTGALVHDFTDPDWDTRFLGDLYQDLSEAARKKYALLQTPAFVEAFILDRTLEPAIDTFDLARPGYHTRLETDGRLAEADRFRMIDPACGSGHFLLGSFARLVEHWRRREPGTASVVLVQRALDSVHGVDLNPFAVAIARFRLLIAALQASGIRELRNAPKFAIHLVCGDALLHGSPGGDQGSLAPWSDFDHVYQPEDPEALRRILRPGYYHAVVANPPYITPKDAVLNQQYRERFSTCHRQYSLAVPFLQRIVSLAVEGGYSGQITANSFMKREFGRKLIESYFPYIDLTHVIDTSGAYIPGHGTPTVILFVRNRRPVSPTLRTVMGIRGEPTTPDDPALGLVWSAIVELIDQACSQNDFVSVGESPRQTFHRHPWSIGGGGASGLKEMLDESAHSRLSQHASDIGFACITKSDDFFTQPTATFRRSLIEHDFVKPFGIGEQVRNWQFQTECSAMFPYSSEILPIKIESVSSIAGFAWPYRTELGNRVVFGGQTYFESGKPWFEYGQIPIERAKKPTAIVFGFIATHNHFVLDRGGKVFNRTAPVIKLPATATEDDHLALLGLLNSSIACFWMKQTFFDRGNGGIGGGIASEAWERFYEHDGTKLGSLPIPESQPSGITRRLQKLATEFGDLTPTNPAFFRSLQTYALPLYREVIHESRRNWINVREQMVAAQEELDWECYRLYGLIDEDLTYGQEPPPIPLGARAFEIVMGTQIAAGELQTTWFERHNSRPLPGPDPAWPQDYQDLVQRRMDVIATNPNIALIERPEYKRRWNTEPWDEQLARALRGWLLNRLESYFDHDGRMNDAGTATARFSIELVSVGRLADVARHDPAFHEVGALYRDDPAFDVERLVAELVEAESVPLLPVLRYKLSGLLKRAEWEQTWELQRLEDDLTARSADPVFARLAAPALPLAPATPGPGSGDPDADADTEADPDGDGATPTGPGSATGSGADRAAAVASDPARAGAGAGRSTESPRALRDQIAALRDRFDRVPETEQASVLAELGQVVQTARARVASIPVPPKYGSGDFLKADFWRLRGKLDVPKERWVSLPHCEGEDGTLMLAWAGYDHLQLAQALSAHYVDIQERLGGRDDPRLVPLLAGVLELLPWLHQWHAAVDPNFGVSMAEYFAGFVAEECRNLNLTPDALRAWTPPARSRGRKPGSTAAKPPGRKGRPRKSAAEPDGTDAPDLP